MPERRSHRGVTAVALRRVDELHARLVGARVVARDGLGVGHPAVEHLVLRVLEPLDLLVAVVARAVAAHNLDGLARVHRGPIAGVRRLDDEVVRVAVEALAGVVLLRVHLLRDLAAAREVRKVGRRVHRVGLAHEHGARGQVHERPAAHAARAADHRARGPEPVARALAGVAIVESRRRCVSTSSAGGGSGSPRRGVRHAGGLGGCGGGGDGGRGQGNVARLVR